MRISQAFGTSVIRSLFTLDAITSAVAQAALTVDEAVGTARIAAGTLREAQAIQACNEHSKLLKEHKITEEELQSQLDKYALPAM
ncbi:MAG: hypothetical protein U9O94_06090 [Nanoarchaeota archaeon]|nr:hypothetical protein [Nanoarchaeota archaeon]